MSNRYLMALSCALASGALALGACGGDDEGGGGGGGGGESANESSGITEGAKVIDVNSMNNASGDVTFCLGKDTSGDKTALAKRFNEENPDINVRLLEFSTSADEQRQQFVQRQEAQSGECDVFYSDVIWTAEFASQKWLYDMTPYLQQVQQAGEIELIPATVRTVEFDGKMWGVPQQTDAAFLYYRTDQIDEVPGTWKGVYDAARENDGIVYQGAPYEGLTVDFLEIAYAAGGKVLNEAGDKSQINSPENLEALKFMVDGVQNGAAARGVVTYMEEEARRYFESGRATFMRNWPYAYALGQDADRIKGKFAVAPFPPFEEGGPTAAILGGHNFVISAFSKNPGAALKFTDYMIQPEIQKIEFLEYSLAPTVATVYDDPEVQEEIPFASELKQSVEQAFPRPVSPVYPQISQAIYENVNAALSGRVPPEQALQQADEQINQALQTF